MIINTMESISENIEKSRAYNSFLWRLFNFFFFVSVISSAGGNFRVAYSLDGFLLACSGLLFCLFTPYAYTISKLKVYIFISTFIFLAFVVNVGYVTIGGWYSKIVLTINLFILMVLQNNYKKDLIENTSKLVSYCLIISFVTWCFVKIGVPLPHRIVIEDENTLEFTKYIFKDYFFFREFYYEFFGSTEFSRFQAFFIEPSTLGKVCLLFLIANDFNIHKWYVKVFFFMLFCSCSLASYLVLGISLLIKQIQNGKIIKIILLILAASTIIISMYNFLPQGNPVRVYIFDRIFRENNFKMEYNRSSEEFDHYFYNDFLKGEHILFGDRQYIKSQLRIPCVDWKCFLVAKGCIGAIAMLLFLSCCFFMFKSDQSTIMICSYFILFLASQHIWDYFVYIGLLTLTLRFKVQPSSVIN